MSKLEIVLISKWNELMQLLYEKEYFINQSSAG